MAADRRRGPRSWRSILPQLWHTGRISHPDLHGGEKPVAPSAIRPEGQAFTQDGMKDHVEPRALTADEIPAIVEDYRRAFIEGITYTTHDSPDKGRRASPSSTCSPAAPSLGRCSRPPGITALT
jgi:hypothetical protein